MIVGKEISRGAYSIVYDVEGQDLAIKHNIADKSSDFYRSLKELDILVRLRSPEIVSLKFLIFDNIEGLKVPPKMDGDLVHFALDRATSSLDDFRQETEYSKELFKPVACQILVGLNLMHARGVIHRDIKPANVLYYGDSREVKLCDFGMSEYYSRGMELSTDMCTMPYRAPEMLFGLGDYDYRIDIWSAGVLFIEFISGSQLFATTSTCHRMIKSILSKFPSMYSAALAMKKKSSSNARFPRPRSRIDTKRSICKVTNLDQEDDEDLVDLISKMMVMDPSERFTSKQCLEHKFFDSMRDDIHIEEHRDDEFDIVINSDKRNVCFVYLKQMKSSTYSRELGSSINKVLMDRVIYHAADTFDRCIEHSINHKLLPQICLYFCSKLLFDSNMPYSFEEVTFSKPDSGCAEIEKLMIEKFENVLYRRTIYEEIIQDLLNSDESMTKAPPELMQMYANVPTGVYTLKTLKACVRSKI